MPAVIASAAASTTTGGNVASNAIDGNDVPGWQSTGTTGWLRVTLTGTFAVTEYRITPTNGVVTLAPKTWTFEGTNDATFATWTTLDTQTNFTAWTSAVSPTFSFTNATAYLYYRVNVTAVNGGSTIGIAELRLSGATGIALLGGNGGTMVDWWRADTITGRSNGDTVAFGDMLDQAGSHHFTAAQGTSLYRPTGAPNNNPAVEASSANIANFYRNTSSQRPTGDQTIFAVCYLPNTTTQQIFGAAAGGLELDISSSKFRLIRQDQLNLAISTTNHPVSTWCIVIAKYTSATGAATFRIITSTTDVTDTIAGTASTFTFAGTPQGWGVYTAPSTNGFRGSMAELGRYGSALGSTDMASLVSYLQNKYFPKFYPPAATVAVSANAPTLSRSALLAPAATVTVSAPAPSLSLGAVGVINLATPAATVNVAAPTPTLTRSALLAPAATVTASAPIPTLIADTVTVSALTAAVTVSAPAPSLTVAGLLSSWVSDLSQQAVVEFTSPLAVLYVEPPAAEAPPAIVERTILRNSIMLDPMTVDTATGRVDPASFDATITGEIGVYHVTVDGVDVTYWRDAPTIIGQMRFSEPGGEDSARLEFPQITSIDEAGTGDLTWLHTDAPVEIFILTPDDDRLHKFSGHLVSDNTGIGTALQSSWDVQGNIRQGDSIVHRVPTILDRTDIGTLVPKYLNEVPGRRYASIPPATTGVTSKDRGSYSDTEWDYSQNLLGSAFELDGDQWTLTRSGINQYSISLKDRDTVHWTVTAGTPGVEFDLTEDVAALVNCIYGRGVGPDGYAWAGWCHPNLLPDDAPDYPMFPITDLIEVSTDDSETTTGNGVTTWQQRVQSLGYAITVDGVYSTADANVARQVQTDYGLLVDGKVGPQTWAATFDTGSGGGDLNGSYRRPLAIISAVDPYLYAANGAIVGINPDYNPNIIRRERNVDYGTGITKAEATVLAGMELARDSVTGWQGSITFKVDPREGSRHLMREGQNVLLQGFRGGDILLHISELSVDPSDDYMPVTVTVDSKARDAMSLSSVAQRDRDSKADPARRPGNPTRRSRQEQDMAVEYDGESGAGVIPHFPVYGGLWSVIRIPVSEVGNVKLTLATTSGPACPFSIGFFGLPLTPAHMDALVGNPLTNDSAWDTNAETLDEQYAFLESFGNSTQAAGYYPGGTTLTGRLKDTGSWEYISGKPPHIWVAIFAQSTCFIEGRVYPAPVV